MLMAAGNLRDVRDATSAGLGDIVDYAGNGGLNAEILSGVVPKWHVLETHPNHERIAAGYLIARRFGVFVPERDEVVVRRGSKFETKRLLFIGYIFVYVWGIKEHARRILACPGVARIIQADGNPAIIPDSKIDEIRAVENSLRPLPATMLYDDPSFMLAKKKKRWRRKPKTAQELAAEDANEIVAVRPWSAFQDALMALDDEGRNQTLRKALGLPS